MDQTDIPALLARLSSDEDAMRKMAVFKLQSSINDPAFADAFLSSGGLVILRRLIMTTGGNTLAYSLQSLSRLLEVDMGWEVFESSAAGELVERIVELIVTHPLVNILRGAMSILVAVVSHSQSGRGSKRSPIAFGFRALKPAIAVYPQFFEMVVSQLNSADHALCANALLLLNALMRDTMMNDSDEGRDRLSKSPGTVEEWPKFIKRLQDLGVIKAVSVLMQSSALQDLAHPLLEFQTLMKVLLRKWRDITVDLEKPEHRRALKSIHLASAPDRVDRKDTMLAKGSDGSAKKGSTKHNPEKWRRLGFESENPAWEFDQMGYLGMMDLTDYVRRHEDSFQKLLQEQAAVPMHQRCPMARASLAVTAILYDHFDIDKSDVEDAKSYQALDGMKNYDRIFQPCILQWSRLHTSGLKAFFRLWKSTGAQLDDFDKVAELVRILVEQVIGQASRTKDVHEIVEEMADFEYSRLRDVQMELLESSFQDHWGQHLQQIRDELKRDALLFVKEQRIRCLSQGAWFPRGSVTKGPLPNDELHAKHGWRFVRLSHNRRYLHYSDFPNMNKQDPPLDQLPEKIDLSTISSVISNVSAPSDHDADTMSTTSTLKDNSKGYVNPRGSSKTKITINAYVDGSSSKDPNPSERPLLTLNPQTHSLASEWLDGLLMLLNQNPITAETNKLVGMVTDFGVKIRLLNVRLEDEPSGEGVGVVPTREGLDEDYYYEV
jgi:engulfment/cell motility protein 1